MTDKPATTYIGTVFEKSHRAQCSKDKHGVFDMAN